MSLTVADLKKGERRTITTIDVHRIPLKLIEMGCLPGNPVTLIQLAPYADPLYLNINGSHLAVRREIACLINIEKVEA